VDPLHSLGVLKGILCSMFHTHYCCFPLQEGAGHQVLSAFVEIVFDNSDNRIPVSFFYKPFRPLTSPVLNIHICTTTVKRAD
jgi:hypothetical protein